jgi:hypothetical protein
LEKKRGRYGEQSQRYETLDAHCVSFTELIRPPRSQAELSKGSGFYAALQKLTSKPPGSPLGFTLRAGRSSITWDFTEKSASQRRQFLRSSSSERPLVH